MYEYKCNQVANINTHNVVMFHMCFEDIIARAGKIN